MAAIRARIKMVGPRQLYRLGSDGAVGMRVYATTNEGEEMERKKKYNKQTKQKKKGSARCCISALLRLSLRFLYIYVYDAKMADPTNLVVRRHRLDDGLADPHVFIYLFYFFFILKPDQRQKSSVCYFFQTPSYPPGLCFDMGQVNVIIRHFFFFFI